MIDRDVMQWLGDVGLSTRDDLAGIPLSRSAWAVYPLEAAQRAHDTGTGGKIQSVAQHATGCPQCGQRIKQGDRVIGDLDLWPPDGWVHETCFFDCCVGLAQALSRSDVVTIDLRGATGGAT